MRFSMVTVFNDNSAVYNPMSCVFNVYVTFIWTTVVFCCL